MGLQKRKGKPKGETVAEEITVRFATMADMGAVLRLYDDVVELDRGTEHDVLWRRDLHPSDASLEEAVAAGQLVLAEAAEAAKGPQGAPLLGAGILNSDFAQGYENVPWPGNFPLEQVRCLHLFCTHPTARGRGVAKRLLAGMANLMRQQGVAAIRLDTFAHNTAARGLYQACGYVYAGPGRMWYEDQDVAHLDFAMYELVL